MKTIIGTSFGLALLLAIGVIATMLAMGLFTSSQVSANPGAMTLGAVTNTPDTPGEIATFTIKFQPASSLTQGDSLYVKFDKNVKVPATVEKERITISASGGGTSNPLSDPEISTDADGNFIIKVTLGDTDPSTTGNQNEIVVWDTTSTNTGHIMTLSSLAGITNSTSPSPSAAWVSMSDDGITYGSDLDIGVYRWLQLNDTSDKRGKALTLTGKGWKSGTATVFIDVNGNQTFESGTDTEIGSSDAAISGGAFTASFSADTNFSVGNNSINAVDGIGVTATDNSVGARYGSQPFTLTGNISLSTSSAARGETIIVTVADYGGSDGSGELTDILFGGAMATLPSTRTFTNNTGTFSVTVPSTTPLGSQTVTVETKGNEGDRTATIVVAGLSVTSTPSTAVANQAVTVSASGFTGSTDLASISVAGNAVATLTDSTSVTDKSTDNSGNLVATFKIPTDETTRTPGEHKITITDDSGRIGEAALTIPSRTLTIDPAESRRGSTISFTGEGYQASSTVSVTYGTSTTPRTTTTADSAGNISGDFTVATTIGIPSTNTVTATISCTSGNDTCTQTTATATHKVPAAVVTVEPTSAASGETITVTGIGFPGYVSLTALTIATVSALPTPAPATDGDGEFTLSALVPQLGTGSQALLVTGGGVTATTSFSVVAAAATPVVTTSATETVFEDEIAADNLVRVWNFDNATQAWSFYDPRPAFAAANTYTDATSANIVWVNVTAETTFQGSTLFAGWNLISLD